MSESMKILVIDDAEDDRLLYSRALQKSTDVHYTVTEASDGEEGLNRVQADQPACILLDYSLPGRNGIEVLKRIRSKHPFIPVVMLTGQGNENVAVAAMQHGAQNYISKSSITPETLDHVIHMAIEHCMLQKRIHEQRTSLEVFTRALAHDLNEPVRTIRSFVELISQFDSFPEKAKTYFQHIQNAADRMHMLIDTVFYYTRLDNPGQLTKEPCAMAVVLTEVEENLAQLIKERKAVITSDSLPEVYANHMQLMQILQNLISNAIHHSEKPVTIHVSALAQGDDWVFKVSDNGPGIEEAYLQKIFDPFKRLTHHEVQGAGLGLATCRKIVEAHGGKIWCESKPGEGAAFIFTLPKALPQSAEVHQAASETSSVNKTAQHNGKQLANVLLVDDSRADVDMTKFRLLERSRLQCNLIVARNGEEALDRLQDKAKNGQPIDLVLLDINMPEMDGFEVLERMRADKTLERISVVMCTGSIYDKDMERAKGLGAMGYLTKPIEFAKLKSAIEQTAGVKLCQEANGYTLLRAA